MRILHVFRTPVGGLFRHVRDLARGQRERGHEVAILCDSTTGGEAATRLLASAETYCSLGITRIPISRLPGIGDVSGITQTIAHARVIKPDIIHCHGAKGGFYGRLAARRLGLPSVYTPHGGSLHYRWGSAAGLAFLSTEWILARLGGGLHFVCDYEKQVFDAKIGIGGKPFRVVHNGLWPEEFALVAPDADAADVLYIGELRSLKGVDVLIDALAIVAKTRPISACLVGDGPEASAFKAQAAALSVAGNISFAGRLPAAAAFRRGRVLVMPSRAESFPYVVLETCAAGVPLITSRVGGIPEILTEDRMVPAGNAAALATCLTSALSQPATLVAQAADDRERVAQAFRAEAMVDGVLGLYRDMT
jgi:glycosyltransferase involved in cell wall biosynthesis